jgi:6-phosphogluconolactonase
MKNKMHSRRKFLGWSAMAALGFSVAGPRRASHAAAANSRLIYVGTYTTGRSEGIYACRLDLSSGELKLINVAKGVVNPSFLAIDGRSEFLYAVNEVTTFGGKASGAVSSFAIDRQSGALKFLSQQPSAGGGPCHLTIDGTGRFVLVANYDGGSVAVLPVRQGALSAPVEIVQHHGSSVNVERQGAPHAHGVFLDRANRLLFVTDLGLDKIMIYRFNTTSGKLTANETPWCQINAGAGPRHFTFHPNGRWGYVINEMASTVTVLSYNAAAGTLKEEQTISTLPAGFAGNNSCAEIEIAPSGRFLYGSNRGHDSIVVYAVDLQSGRLELRQHAPTEKTPRNFKIDPGGELLVAANQNSDSLITFRVDKASGQLSATGQRLAIPAPVCIVMSDKL